jgi:membrane fusion protein, copper/silver efflux system
MQASKKILWGVVIAVVVLMALAYQQWMRPAEPVAPSAPAADSAAPALGSNLVKLANVQEDMVRQSVLINGKLALNGNRIHQMSARVAGRIDRLSFVEGSLVQAGQPVAWLYSPEFISAQNEYLLAMHTVRTLRQGGAGDLLADAQATFEAARQKMRVLGAADADIAELERTGQVQQHLIVRSGMSGHVIKRNVDPGGYLDVGGSLGTVADLSSLWFMGHVFDADLPHIHSGQKVSIKVNGLDAPTPLTGMLSFISPTLDPDTHSVAVRVELPNVSNQLKPEMFARGEIELGMRKLPVVPRSAVVQDGAESFIMVQRGGTADKPGYQRVALQTMPTNDPALWAVLKGLSAGERVVVEGSVLVEREHVQSEIIHGNGQH